MAAQAPIQAQARAPHVDVTIAELKKLYGDRVSTAHAVREQHGKDISFHEAHLPDAVVFAESAEEVQRIVQLCAQHKTPIIAFGTGTSLEGHISAPNGGISLDVSRMNKVLQVNEADLDVVVQPGVTRKQLRALLPDRSRRRRLAGRHDQHARFGHQRGALWHDARERAGAAGRHRRRPPDAARPPLAQILGGL